VDSSEDIESWDIYASMFGGIPDTEINILKDYWDAFPSLKDNLFNRINSAYVSLSVDNIKDTIQKNKEVINFGDSFEKSFKDFDSYLRKELIKNMEHVSIPKEEDILSKNIFKRLEKVPLIDNYAAYQLLHESWNKISIDLELIQTEGTKAIRQVDPNMVIKTKNKKEEEVQEGWVGHIIPFNLVQEMLLKKELAELKQKESRVAEISSEYEEIIENLQEEDKESDALNEDKTAFVNAVIIKSAKNIRNDIKNGTTYADESFENTILKVDKLITEEKALKKQIKQEGAKLQEKTIEVIHSLSDEQVNNLLNKKWIEALLTGLYTMPQTIVDELASKIQSLVDKYAITLAEVDKEIKETETGLMAMIDDLQGNEFDMKGLKAFKALLKGE
jgi:type I restriction enzyme M protein